MTRRIYATEDRTGLLYTTHTEVAKVWKSQGLVVYEFGKVGVWKDKKEEHRAKGN